LRETMDVHFSIKAFPLRFIKKEKSYFTTKTQRKTQGSQIGNL
jgi:hypothetical protein